MNTPCSPAEHGVLLLRPRSILFTDRAGTACRAQELCPTREDPLHLALALACCLRAARRLQPSAGLQETRVPRWRCPRTEAKRARGFVPAVRRAIAHPQTASSELDERPARRRQTRPPLLHLMGCVTSLLSRQSHRPASRRECSDNDINQEENIHAPSNPVRTMSRPFEWRWRGLIRAVLLVSMLLGLWTIVIEPR